jgi:hypothetical protein
MSCHSYCQLHLAQLHTTLCNEVYRTKASYSITPGFNMNITIGNNPCFLLLRAYASWETPEPRFEETLVFLTTD